MSESKSAIIRRYVQRYPNKAPVELAKLITSKESVEVNGSNVSTIKWELKKNGHAQVASNGAAQAPPPAGVPPLAHQSMAEAIGDFKQKVRSVGGPDEARKLIDVLFD
jgi:hypothetical protein